MLQTLWAISLCNYNKPFMFLAVVHVKPALYCYFMPLKHKNSIKSGTKFITF